MRLLSIAPGTLIAAMLLSGCSMNGSPAPPAVAPLQRHLDPALAARQGIYVAQSYGSNNVIAGFRDDGKGPICHVEGTFENVVELSTDRAGNLIVPNGSSSLSVYGGPDMCGPLYGTIGDAYVGEAVAIDAINGPIVVDQDNSNEVAVCYLSDNACTPLKSPNMAGVASVALDTHGNCYADAVDDSGQTGLWIYRNCKGRGKELTSAQGFSETWLGDIAVDDRGNLATIAYYGPNEKLPSTLTVYSGCITGACKVIGGPFNFKGETITAHLSLKDDRLVATDAVDNKVEIYSYGDGTSLKFLYGFDGCGGKPYTCGGATYSFSAPK